MVTRVEATRETREPLSRERVLSAAVALADEGGSESLSMRKLAQQLGVEAMSLYHWFASKDELLEGMLGIVFSEIEVPASGGDWQSAMRTTAISAHRTLLRHRWACSLLMNQTAPSHARLEYMNSVLGRLREAGFSDVMTHHAYHALDSHIVGFTLWLLPYLAISQEQPNFAQDFLAQTPIADLPHLAEHIDVHVTGRAGETSEFDFGLDLLLDGLERLRTAA